MADAELTVVINPHNGGSNIIVVHAQGCPQIAKQTVGYLPDWYDVSWGGNEQEFIEDYNHDYDMEVEGWYPIHFYECAKEAMRKAGN